MKTTTRKITYGALVIACAVILPQLFHLSGIPSSGAVFLPMHIPVLLGGFILGPWFGALVGALSPLVSSLLTAMPALARLPFMMIELAGYGFFAGLMYQRLGFFQKKCGTYISLVSAMLFGRVLYSLAAFVAAEAFHMEKAGGILAGVNATMTGFAGIVIQLMFIPPLVYALRRAGMLDVFLRRTDGDSTGKEIQK